MKQLFWKHAAPALTLGAFSLFCLTARAQQGATTPAVPAASPAATASSTAAAQGAPTPAENPPHGQVLFESHGEPPASSATDRKPPPAASLPTGPPLDDSERSAITFTAYDLDARLTPATSRLAMRARLTLRNDGQKPLGRIALQISSTLAWEGAALLTPAGSQRLPLAQHLLDTDADHTGKADEAVLTLPQPLAPGKSLTLDTFYSGAIPLSGERLERIGAGRSQVLAADWDEIAPGATALRGFGDVLWYPVASPQLFLGEGALLFDAIGQTKLREETASIHLRLSVEYAGDPPVAAYFCGRREPFTALSDDANAPIASGRGVATAEFAAEPLGFRMPSLFLIDSPETLIAPLPSPGSSNATVATGTPMLAVETEDDPALPALAGSAQSIAPLLEEWLGSRPLSALTVLDHAGQPFEDGPLLVAPIASLTTPGSTAAMAHILTFAWVQTGRPWMDEGLAQFFMLLWTEREQGRAAALKQYEEMLQPLAISEPEIEPATPTQIAAPNQPATPNQITAQPSIQPVVGQPLIAATSELYFRRKAAAVWWMLRGITGDRPLALALQAWRMRAPEPRTAAEDALAFESLLEKTSGQDLRWFFNDWVLRDRGLPDLSITDVTPRELPAGPGHSTGWLVAVTVHNAGAAEADVPVVVRSGTYSETSRLRIPGFANATARVLVESPPDEVLVNDGSTPEQRSSTHERMVLMHDQ